MESGKSQAMYLRKIRDEELVRLLRAGEERNLRAAAQAQQVISSLIYSNYRQFKARANTSFFFFFFESLLLLLIKKSNR